jgi:hypothetical protein
MPSEKRPDWLVRQENGIIAEARTRSFLLDRFWILERSVDIEGVLSNPTAAGWALIAG